MTFGRAWLAIYLLAWGAAAPAQDGAANEQAIRAAARDYQAAVAKGDSQAIAQFWTAEGTFTDERGNPRPASELIAEAARSTGAPASQGRTTSTIRFVTSDVAIEDGASEIDLPGGETARGSFHATWVKQDGRWRLASLCEMPRPSPESAELADLGWMVGEWSARDGEVDLQVSVRWNATGTYLLRDLKAAHGAAVFRSSQRIGIDPRTGKLVSWTFDSDGGLGEATWSKLGDRWIAHSTGVLADGRETAGTNVVTREGDDALVWKTAAASVEGQSVEDHAVRFTRRSEARQ